MTGGNAGLVAAGVRVPCSTSNLGSGFDCIGLAFDRCLEVRFNPAVGGGLRVERSGTLAALETGVEGDAVAAAFTSDLAASGAGPVHGVLVMDSRIPVGRGLGSSAAATVAGLLLAAAVTGRQVDRGEVLTRSARIEGHPDNAAPAIFGGLVGVVQTDAGPRAFPLPLSDGLTFAYAAPAVEVSTADARRALPESVTHAAAVRGLGRAAALVHGLATGDGELLRSGFRDELHVPYRLPLIPGAAAAMEAAVAAGAHAATISGSGSGLIAVCPAGTESAVADAMHTAFGGNDAGVIAFPLQPDLHGACILP